MFLYGGDIMLNFQTSIFYNLQEFIETSPLYRKYYFLFQSLDLSEFSDGNTGVGCTGYSRRAIFRAFIIKHLEEIKTVPRLIEYLENHPVITDLCGFDMRKNLPDESQFYRFLKTTDNSVLKTIHHRINKKLIEEKIISRDTFILDSKPVMAATKDNNFKNSNRNTTNKDKKPKRNPSATLSYYSHQNINGKKKNQIFFWGYRTHVIVSKEGIPLIELTLPNNQTDAKVAKKLIKKLKRVYGFKKTLSSSLMPAMMKKMCMTLLLMNLNAKLSSPLIHEILKMIKHLQPMAAQFVKLILK